MRPRILRALVVLGAAASAGACAVTADVDLGHDLEAGGPAVAASDAAPPGSDASAPAVSAAISAATGSVCAGQCVDLVASASGGSGSYAYAWGQDLGDGPGPKKVCPVETTTYSVLVGPSEGSSGPLSSASLRIDVRNCGADSGPAPPPVEGGTPNGPPTGSLCVDNPSFEVIGMAGTSALPPTVAPDWQACSGNPNDPSLSLLPASDGMTYVGLLVGSAGAVNVTASIGTALCAPLQPGVQASFCIDVGVGVRGLNITPGTTPPVLEIWGGQAACSEHELLWTSPPITTTDAWTTACGSFVPSSPISTLTLVPALGATSTGSLSYVIVDHIVARP